jgi:hypothetical protein
MQPRLFMTAGPNLAACVWQQQGIEYPYKLKHYSTVWGGSCVFSYH